MLRFSTAEIMNVLQGKKKKKRLSNSLPDHYKELSVD